MKRPRLLPLSLPHGFTLLELLTVMTIIMILAGMVLAGMGYAQQKAALSRAQAEIAALSTALESYKADNGEYPKDTSTDALDPSTSGNPTAYTDAGKTLYYSLRSDYDQDGKVDETLDDNGDVVSRLKAYFEFKDSMLSADKSAGNAYMVDPFGNAYGYSTKGTYNPTFDLWSTGRETATPSAEVQEKWVKNW